jgi:hypothetical protein
VVWSGEEERESVRPEFTRSIMIDFPGVKITSTAETVFRMLREIDDRFGVIAPVAGDDEAGRKS